eukprot:tig00000808_g4430.t1
MSKRKLDAGILEVSCTAPVNMAVIKYWGKRDSKLILPVNSSLSATLDQADLMTHTTVTASKGYERDRMWLNGKEHDIDGNEETAMRLRRCIAALRERAGDVEHDDGHGGKIVVRKEDWPHYKLHIASVNNFPTAAGLASSASGLACFVYTCAQLLGVKEAYAGELTSIARMGSGSACRSLAGGFVRWNMGAKADGSDSIAEQVVTETHWPELRILILVVNDEQKDTGSTPGMQLTVSTSPLMQHRAGAVVPGRLAAMEAAIAARDFDAFARITMQESNELHAVCLDTFPPIFYMNDVSRAIVRMVHQYNERVGSLAAGYTFDAGPNACIFTTAERVPGLLAAALHLFPPSTSSPGAFLRDPALAASLGHAAEAPLPPSAYALPEALRGAFTGQPRPDALKYIISTRVGPGPQRLPPRARSLIDLETGFPKA